MATISFDAQWLTIANRALLRIGSKTLTSFDDGSAESKYCTILLPQAIETVVSAYNWRDCIKRAQLAPLADAPVFGISYQFSLPEDYAKLNSVSAVDSDGNEVEWFLENGVIVSDAVSVNITYTAIPGAPENVSPSTRDLIVKQLAYLLSIPIVNNTNRTSMLLSEYSQTLSIAMNRNSVTQYQEDTSIPYYVDEDR
ncbi:MAG: hypothetical protein JXK93_13480 [Sphaerochaetaceae bacterium]|nr:hypothetical protein [Sphaerochaetaceae bacterium]